MTPTQIYSLPQAARESLMASSKLEQIPSDCIQKVVTEPVAAAFTSWFSRHEDLVCTGDPTKDKETVLVCDLGGGTFDATVVHMNLTRLSPSERPTLFAKPIAVSGDNTLGGSDYTTKLTVRFGSGTDKRQLSIPTCMTEHTCDLV